MLSKSEHGRICVTINRDKVKDALYNNEGKYELCQKTFGDPSTIEIARCQDNTIHEFLCGKNQEPKLFLPLKELHLRWASGGVISVIHWRGRRWTPFFFRDIPPYGWNISLGASEKEDDLNDPWTFVLREFLEETLILDAQPVAGQWISSKKFLFERLATGFEILHAREFSTDHIRERYERDHLLIDSTTLQKCICVDFLNTHTDVIILHGNVPHPYRNVLVGINLLELGIEIVKVLEYSLDDNDFILDGEMLKMASDQQLLRLPVALISHDYLARAFNPHIELTYIGKTQPSIEGPPIPEEEIHIFPFDAERRRSIALVLKQAVHSSCSPVTKVAEEISHDLRRGRSEEIARS